MARKGAADLPPLEVPQPQGAVVAPRHNAIPPGAKGHRPNPAGMARKEQPFAGVGKGPVQGIFHRGHYLALEGVEAVVHRLDRQQGFVYSIGFRQAGNAAALRPQLGLGQGFF